MDEFSGYKQCDVGAAEYADLLALWQRAGLHISASGRDAPDAFARQMAGGTQRVIGLRSPEGELVAVAVLTHDGRKGWINRLAVDPAHRRRGLAQAVIKEAERWFAEDVGLDIWAALIVRDNDPSLSLFKRAGYQRHEIVYVRKRTRDDA